MDDFIDRALVILGFLALSYPYLRKKLSGYLDPVGVKLLFVTPFVIVAGLFLYQKLSAESVPAYIVPNLGALADIDSGWSIGKTPHIEDNSKILAAFLHHLEYSAQDWENTLGIEVKIITLPNTSEKISTLANRLFHEKDIGKGMQTGGLLVLIVSGTGEARIEIAASLEGVFTDGALGLMAKNQLAPYASYQAVGMGIMDILHFLKDHALEQAVHGNFDLPEEYRKTTDYLEKYKAISIGGGAQTSIPDVPTDRDFRRPVPESMQSLYAPAATPRETLEAYKRSLNDYIGYPELPLFTEGTQEMRRWYPFAPYEERATLRAIIAAEPFNITEKGDYAIVYKNPPPVGVMPILMKKVGGLWRIDRVEALKNFFFLDGGKFNMENTNMPYYSGLKHLRKGTDDHDIGAFLLKEGELKNIIETLKARHDALSKFMLAELLFRNAFATVAALRYYEEAIRLAPDDPKFLSTFVDRSLYIYFPELAIPALKKLDASEVFKLARAYSQRSKYAGLEKLIQQTLKMNTYDSEALKWLRFAMNKQDKKAESREIARLIKKLDGDKREPANPVKLFFYPAKPVYHSQSTKIVQGTEIYGHSAFSVTMHNTSQQPVEIDSVRLRSIGTGPASGLGDIKDYWKYPSGKHRLRANEKTSFEKEWGFTINPEHQRVSYVFDICWRAVGSMEHQCRAQRLDLVSNQNILPTAYNRNTETP